MFALLWQAMAGEDVPLPNPMPILPYLDLFTIVILRPQSLIESFINTRHLPALSILQGNRFEFAPDGTLPGDENVARIFDVECLNNQHPAPVSLGGIPLSPEDPDFAQQHYWRLPLPTEVILAALINQVERGDFESEEIRVAQAIYHRLMLERLELGDDGGAGPSHSGGPSSGPGRGRGTGRGGMRPGARRGGGSRLSVTKLAHTMKLRSTDPPPKKRRGKTGRLRSRPLEAAESGLSEKEGEESFIKFRIILTLFDK